MKSKGKVYATALSDSDSSNSDSDESCDREGNYSAFMTIAHVESSEDLNLLVEELGEHNDEESIRIVEESDVEEDENAACLQECSLNGELSEAYTKVRFLEQEVMQANAKIERVSTMKLNDVISSQKQFSDKFELGYTRGSSSSGNVTKKVKFIKAKEQIEVCSTAKKPNMEEKRNVDDKQMLNNSHKQSVGRSESRAKSRPRLQVYVCDHCGLQGHTRPNCQKLRAMNNASAPRSQGPRNVRRN